VGRRVVFVDNRAIVVRSHDLDTALGRVIDLSLERSEERAR